jgi:hypothetical protein
VEKAYWLKRELASLKLARKAGRSKAGLAQFELAGRYRVKAVNAGIAASALGGASPADIEAAPEITKASDDV